MPDFEARKVIEALRSGVSSRVVGQYFSSARQELISHVSARLARVADSQTSDGMLITGQYGEGKTHLLNTVFNLAHSANMAVSFVSLSKETPLNNLPLVYQKLLANTYLPRRLQPGFMEVPADATPNSPLAADMLAFAFKQPEVDKLFYLLRAYFGTDDPEEKFLLQSDLEGDFIAANKLKQIYRRIYNEKVTYNVPFAKTKHMNAYFALMSRLFLAMGCRGWVVLLDEGELIGRLSKKARLKAYSCLADFLFPKPERMAMFTLCAFTNSYIEEVIEAKHEFDNLAEAAFPPDEHAAAEKTLHALLNAKQLAPLTQDEIAHVMDNLLDFYKRAYDWHPNLDMAEIRKRTDHRGFLLRTRIRAAVECLDQLYQYNNLSDIHINALGQVSYEEGVPSLEGAL